MNYHGNCENPFLTLLFARLQLQTSCGYFEERFPYIQLYSADRAHGPRSCGRCQVVWHHRNVLVGRPVAR